MKRIIISTLNKLGFYLDRYLKVCFKYDFEKYRKYSGINYEEKSYLDTKIRITCHTIEKALSLSDCRADFGRQKVESLISMLESYTAIKTSNKDTINMCISTLTTYKQFRDQNGLDTSFLPIDFAKLDSDIICGAMPYISNIEDFKYFDSIAKSRHSIRNYSDKPIKDIDIQRAVKLAQTAPSACNRQATRIYAITDSTKIELLKQRHGGIRSFGTPGVIFAIAQDLSMYINEYERNTWIVDAGIFCMNMLYSLNTVGIVNCPVIWGGMEDEDTFIAKLIGLKPSERVAVLVVGGYTPEEGVKTPCSPKRGLGEILTIVNK